MTETPVTGSRRTLADVMSEVEDWVVGRHSYSNLNHVNPDLYPPNVTAAMDAQEVVKLAAYARLLADLETPNAR